MKVVAVDWSGDAHLAGRRIWLAEAVEPGCLVRLEAGRDRASIATHLVGLRDELAIGLDFGFAFPSWYADHLGLESAPELWAHVAQYGESWLTACEPPFWGRRGRPRPAATLAVLRRAELAVPRTRGIAPKSVFQIGGAGAVGTGTIRGMPLLHQLHLGGARIWPFASGGLPVVVEIYPRLLTGGVRKSDPRARAELLASRYPSLDPHHRGLAIASEDAFDAAVSALVMVEHVADLAALPEEPDPQLRLEGRIWHPAWQSDRI